MRASDSASRKISSSSEEMDTSEEMKINLNQNLIADRGPTAGKSDDPNYGMEPAPPQPKRVTPEEHANEVICEAEKSKARMYGIPGKETTIAQMDEDYQMIDSHVDPSLKQKILNLEYVDFSKLIAKGKHEEDYRLEFVTRNGSTYLSPVSERESIQVSSYQTWEQAFRVFSNILISCFPEKALELLQYNHTIHIASGSYHWENVYSYDKEFQHHISRHPECSWSLILQQAWTMLLKDRLKSDNHFFQRGSFSGSGGKTNKKDREPCRHFNRGKCTFGLSCKFDHHCSVPKCGKFGHSAHICRLRDTTDKVSGSGTPGMKNPAGKDVKD